MALIAGDWTVATNGNIRYEGAAHGVAAASYATVIEFHRWLQDLADDASASGDDLLDITDTTPSDRSTDNIITLFSPYNIDQTAAEHLYDGSIIQGGGTDIWDGIVNYGNIGIDIQVIQNGLLETNDFWNYTPSTEKTDSTATVNGVNAAGQDILNVSDGTQFSVGDYILIGAVLDEKYRIHAINTNALTLSENLVTATSGAEIVYIGLSGLNRDPVQGISHRFMLKTRTAGTDVDARRILGITREHGKTYGEFNINSTSRGNNVLALSNSDDLNNATAAGVVSGWDTITNAKADSTTTVDGINALSATTLNVVSGAAFIVGDFISIGTETSEYQVTNITVNALTITPGLELATTGGEIVYTHDFGYRAIDVDNDTVDENYYSEWDKATFSINQFYERTKYLQRIGSIDRLYGLDAQIFRGITHEIVIDTNVGTFALVEPVSWGAGATAGTGQMLAIDSTAAGTKMWIQLLTGAAPTDGLVITGGVSGATSAVNVTVTDRSALVSPEFVGASTGSALIGAYGIGVEALDLASADKVFDLTNTQKSPPDYQTTTVAGLINLEDRVLIGPETGGGLLDTQLAVSTAITSGVTSIIMKTGTETIGTGTQFGTDCPSSGVLRVKDDTGIFWRVPYSAVVHGAGIATFTVLAGDTTGLAAAIDNDGFIAYVDAVAVGTIVGAGSFVIGTEYEIKTVGTTDFTLIGAASNTIGVRFTATGAGTGTGDAYIVAATTSFITIFHSARTLFVRVRDGGGSPIKTFESTVSLGGSVTAIRTSDQ